MPTKKQLEQEIELLKEEKQLRSMHTIISSHATKDGEFYLSGTDEYGEDLTIVFSSYNFLMWIDDSTIENIKENLIEQINNK
tara:strand:- start:4974 stop:5219 length:246 start_codon:yes stop_codon:yes gene_type:complete